MITNIIDSRKKRYRWQKITAVIEPTCHDNSCDDSDQAKRQELWFGYDDKDQISVEEAIAWANGFPGDNTLYIYDLGILFNETGDYNVKDITEELIKPATLHRLRAAGLRDKEVRRLVSLLTALTTSEIEKVIENLKTHIKA